MIMSNNSISMTEDYDYSFHQSAQVMEVHFFSMFAPGFITGRLIELYGSFLVSLMGSFIFAISCGAFLIGTELWNFFVSFALYYSIYYTTLGYTALYYEMICVLFVHGFAIVFMTVNIVFNQL